MIDLIPFAHAPAIVSLLVVAVMFLLFLRETYPVEVVAISAAAFLMAEFLRMPYQAIILAALIPAACSVILSVFTQPGGSVTTHTGAQTRETRM